MLHRLSFVVIVLGLINCALAQSELPPESALPAASALPRASLPHESELPLAMLGQPPVADALPPIESLPDESRLPVAAANAEVDPPGPLPLAGSPDGIPWLRLNPNGHTAPIRAIEFMADGDRLCTAGDDKGAIVWSRGLGNANRWHFERTIRWQIQRGTRGRIYSLALLPGQLAIAGEGAMVGTGEIILVDPASGGYRATLFDEANGHRQVVVALDALQTQSGPVVASQSMDGRTLVWKPNQQGVWKATVVAPDDIAAGASNEQANRLLAARVFSGVVAVDEDHVIVPVAEPDTATVIGWRLQLVNYIDSSKQFLGGTAGPVHKQFVTSIASDARRQRLVSSDGAANVYVWDLRTRPAKVQRLNRPQPAFVLDVALSDDGNTLAVGTTMDEQSKSAIVEIWDLSNVSRPKLTASHKSSAHVMACGVSPDGRSVAYAEGEKLVVRTVSDGSEAQRLQGSTEKPLRVAFAKDEPYYKIGIGTKSAEDGGVLINRTFDTDQLRLVRATKTDTQDWLPSNWGQGKWNIAEAQDSKGRLEWWLEEAGARRGRLPLAEERTGVYRTACWMPGDDLGQPPLVAVGTSSGEILVCRVVGEGSAPVVRRLRGHASEITSLAISRDLQWLVSACADATVRIWPLGGAGDATNVFNRWGAKFKIDDQRRLVVDSIDANGPLYFRSARTGDEIVSLLWQTGDKHQKATIAEEMKKVLDEVAWDQAIEFEIRTARQPSRGFQLLPAWQQLVSLVIDSQGEWAYWAPSGYYDASFEGHRLFGWQINRGLDELPDYFLAAQFRGVLEKPDVMSRLLRSGSLEGAFKAAQSEAPSDAAQTVAHTYRLKPDVTIRSPEPGIELGKQGAATIVRARIRIPAGQVIVPPKAFANAVVAPPGKVVSHSQIDGDEVVEYEWQMAVPSDPRVLLQVIASTENEVTDSDELVVTNTIAETGRKPRLFWLAAGVDKYGDAQIPNLRTPVAHSTALIDLVQTQSNDLFHVEATLLIDSRATRPAWNVLMEHCAEQIRRDASPDDLLVIYLSGHGVQDIAGQGFYYVTADAQFAEVMAGSYADCLSLDDFAQFADVSCRKLVILDTCHSGAIQPMRHREIKSAIRALQQDQLLTLAASHGSEEAVEGRFSKRLLQGLKGDADRLGGNKDGVVSFAEVVAYVQRAVADDSIGDTQLQTPLAGPTDLLPYLELPLSRASQPSAIGRDSGESSLRVR